MDVRAKEDPSIGQLFGTLARETGLLVRQEVQLASAEMSRKAKLAAVDASMVGIGAAIAHAGLVVLLVGCAIGLSAWLPLWLTAVLVGLVAAGAGVGLLWGGVRALRGIDPKPEKAIRSLQQNHVWLKEQLP